MILLDNAVYVTNACSLIQSTPGYRVIPLGISCLTGGDLFTTSVINFISIFIILYILFRTFDFNKKVSIYASGIFGFNSYVAFPFFYAAAHSYVYTIMACVTSLYVITRTKNIRPLTIISLIACAIFLKLVRSEGPLYFLISYIAYLIHSYLKSVDLKDFWEKNKLHILLTAGLMGAILILNEIFQLFLSPGEKIAKNLQENKYGYQFPKSTFKAVAIWATYDYLKAFLAPHTHSFFGNYNDWYTIHNKPLFQNLLYGSFGLISISSVFLILTKKKNILSYLIIALSIFIIPGFLISSFLRNQWFYPSRSLLGCYLALPFIVMAYFKIKKHRVRNILALTVFFLSITTFFVHHFSHYKNASTMYQYEAKFLGHDHPTVNKVYALRLFKEKNFFESTKILNTVQKTLPEKGIYLSANHYFLWAENLYWTAASSFYYNSPLTEEQVLRKLYKQPNFFSALACLQDKRTPLEKCLTPSFLKNLCNPSYKKKFGYRYYKTPRLKAEMACAKQHR